MAKERVTHAIILAGGTGGRLRPYTSDRPKPMVNLGGEPILAYQLRQMVRVGVKEVVFAVSYKHEFLEKVVGDGRRYAITAKYSVEEVPLGRGGGIKKAMGKMPGDWRDVLVTNGDNLWKVDLVELLKLHRQRDAIATIVGVPLKSPYGIIDYNDRQEILGFREKPELPFLVNAGIYVFSQAIVPLLPDIGDHETETFPGLVETHRFLMYFSRGYWRGIDTIKDLTEAEKDLPKLGF